jgi:hypothetical protein
LDWWCDFAAETYKEQKNTEPPKLNLTQTARRVCIFRQPI